MGALPKARWHIGERNLGASVWTRQITDEAGDGGGYYLYDWARNTFEITLTELTHKVSKEERQGPGGKASTYMLVDTITVPADIREQNETGRELYVAQLIHADMIRRFGVITEWIDYDSSGKKVWFHEVVTG